MHISARKLAYSLILALAGVAAMVAPILGGTYTATLTLVENGTAARTNYPFIASANVTGWVNGYYIASNGLDVAMKKGGAAVPLLLANDKMLWFDSIAQGGTNNYLISTGNTPVSSMPIIVGNGGSIARADTASMELGANFEIEYKTYLDTTQNTNFLTKTGAINIAESTAASGTVTATTYLASYVASYPTVTARGNNSDTTVTSHVVTIPAGSANDLVLICFSYPISGGAVTKPASTTNLQISNNTGYGIRADYILNYATTGSSTVTYTTASNASCSWTVYRVSGYSGELAANVATASGAADPPSLTVPWGTAYNLFIAAEIHNAYTVNAAPAGYSSLLGGSTGGIGASAEKTANNATDNPSAFSYAGSPTESASLTIGIAPAQISITSTATSVAAGVHTVKLNYDGANIRLYIDGTLKDTDAATAAVINNANAWAFGSAATQYTEYIKITVGGTLVVWYQPNTIISGTTLPDRQGTAENATITWGTNPAGLTPTLKSFYPSEGSGSGSLDTKPDTPGVLGNLPGADNSRTDTTGTFWDTIVNALIMTDVNGGLTAELIWWGAYLLCIVFGYTVTYAKLQKQFFATAVVVVISCGFCLGLHTIPGVMLALSTAYLVGCILWESRQTVG